MTLRDRPATIPSGDAVPTLTAPVAICSALKIIDISREGVEQQQTPRDVAFCAHAILQDKPFIIRDATKDKRFAGNSLVAGVPLVNPEGMALGTLCVVDRQPRRLSAEQLKTLQALSRQVMALLVLRRVSARLANALEQVKALQGLLPICAWCKRIRDDAGYWDQVEAYFHKHTGADFTHGICPQCLEKLHAKWKHKESATETAQTQT